MSVIKKGKNSPKRSTYVRETMGGMRNVSSKFLEVFKNIIWKRKLCHWE